MSLVKKVLFGAGLVALLTTASPNSSYGWGGAPREVLKEIKREIVIGLEEGHMPRGKVRDKKGHGYSFYVGGNVKFKNKEETIVERDLTIKNKKTWYYKVTVDLNKNEIVKLKRISKKELEREFKQELKKHFPEVYSKKKSRQQSPSVSKKQLERALAAIKRAESSGFSDFIPYSAMNAIEADFEIYLKNYYPKTREFERFERMAGSNKRLTAAYWQMLNANNLKPARDFYHGYFNSDGSLDLAGRCLDSNYDGWIVFLTSQSGGYKVNRFKRDKKQTEYSSDFSLVKVKRRFNSSEYSLLEKLASESKIAFGWQPEKPYGFEQGSANYGCTLIENAWVGNSLRAVSADWFYFKNNNCYRLHMAFQPEGVFYTPRCNFRGLHTPNSVIETLLEQ